MAPEDEREALRHLDRAILTIEIQLRAFVGQPGPERGSDLLDACQKARAAYLDIDWHGFYAQPAHANLLSEYTSAVTKSHNLLNLHTQPLRDRLYQMDQQLTSLHEMERDTAYWRDDAR